MTTSEAENLRFEDIDEEAADRAQDRVAREMGIKPIKIDMEALKKFEESRKPKGVKRIRRGAAA